jgi:hypothetical protein
MARLWARGIVVGLAVSGVIAGCASAASDTGSGPSMQVSSPPAVGSSVQVVNPRGLTLPLDAYLPTNAQGLMLKQAFSSLYYSCVSQVTPPSSHMTRRREALDPLGIQAIRSDPTAPTFMSGHDHKKRSCSTW